MTTIKRIFQNKSRQVPDFKKIDYKSKNTRFCVCIPVLNEGERIILQLRRMKACNIPKTVDILIADGGSTDGSLAEEVLVNSGVRTLLIKTGPGKLSAQLRMGYAFALAEGYKGIVTIDGNNKDNVEAIFDFISCLESGYDFIQGSRYLPGGQAVNTPFVRTLAVKLIHVPLISFSSGYKYTDTTNGFRAYSRRFLLDDRVQPFRDIFKTYELLAYLSVVAPKLNFRVKEIPVTRSYPIGGKTPTKISGIKGNIELLKILFNTTCHRYNPNTYSEEP